MLDYFRGTKALSNALLRFQMCPFSYRIDKALIDSLQHALQISKHSRP